MPLQLQFLPAQEGDAIWIRWGDTLEHQMLIDMGREGTGKSLRRRLEALPEDRRHFELLVVTHVDADHIAGVLTGLAEAEPIDDLTFGDIWFNGWAHLSGDSVPPPQGRAVNGLEAMGPAQGARLTSWLNGPWNEAFGRGPVERDADSLPRRELPGGLTVAILGPTRARLEGLRPKWEEEVRKALAKEEFAPVSRRLEPLGRGRPRPPRLASWSDLEALASTRTDDDSAEANGSSICLLAEWSGRRALLTGDAWPADVVAGLQLLGEPGPVPLDLVKLPHHGSQANCTDELASAICCPQWVMSTNGSRFYHPDAVAIARLLRPERRPRPELVFNVPSEFNQWWTDSAWMRQFEYRVVTGNEDDGVMVTLDPA